MNFIASPYYSQRNGYKPQAVVIHTTVGFYQGTINYFKSNTRSVSSHYVTSLNGECVQMVDEDRASHHAGIVYNPKPFPWYKPGVNPNFYTIGIENADDNNPHGADRTKQMPLLIDLVADICKRNNIPATREYIVGHKELYGKKTCPGNIDLEVLVAGVRQKLQSPPSTGTVTPMDQFEENGLKSLREYRKIRPQPEGNFEGFVNSIIGNDKQHNDLTLVASRVSGLETLLSTKEAAIESMKDQIKILEEQVKNPPTTPAAEPVFTNPVAAFFYKMAKFAQE